MDEKWTFQEFYASLDAAFLHHERSEKAAKKDIRQRPGPNMYRDDYDFGRHSQMPMRTFFEGQGTNGRPRKPGSSSSAPATRMQSKPRLWFNCGYPGHFIRNCSKQRNIMKTVVDITNTGYHPKTIFNSPGVEQSTRATRCVQHTASHCP